VNQAEVEMSWVGATSRATATAATPAISTAMVVKLARASSSPASSRARQGWRTSRLRSVPWLYSLAIEIANTERATTPMKAAAVGRMTASPSLAANCSRVTLPSGPPSSVGVVEAVVRVSTTVRMAKPTMVPAPPRSSRAGGA
jgi:hypothetical protein